MAGLQLDAVQIALRLEEIQRLRYAVQHDIGAAVLGNGRRAAGCFETHGGDITRAETGIGQQKELLPLRWTVTTAGASQRGQRQGKKEKRNTPIKSGLCCTGCHRVSFHVIKWLTLTERSPLSRALGCCPV